MLEQKENQEAVAMEDTQQSKEVSQVNAKSEAPLAPSGVKIIASDESDVFAYLDSLDEEVIVNQLLGLAVTQDAWVYSFKDKKGKTNEDLTKIGVDEAIRLMSEKEKVFLREDVLKVFEDEETCRFVVRVERYLVDKEGKETLLDSRIGAKKQDKKKYLKKSQKWIPDPFYFEAGLQKAIRNANKRFIPQSIKQQLIEAAKKAGKVQFIDAEYREEEPPEVQGEQSVEKKLQAIDENGKVTLTPKQKNFLSMLGARTLYPGKYETGKVPSAVFNEGRNYVVSALMFIYGNEAVKKKTDLTTGKTDTEITIPRKGLDDFIEKLQTCKTKAEFDNAVEKMAEATSNLSKGDEMGGLKEQG